MKIAQGSGVDLGSFGFPELSLTTTAPDTTRLVINPPTRILLDSFLSESFWSRLKRKSNLVSKVQVISAVRLNGLELLSKRPH